MNLLLLFFALPIATILLAIVWQKIVKSPILVAITAFAIYLIVTFIFFDASFLIFAIVYTILAFIAAWITKFICENIRRGIYFRNINAENINTNTLSANTLEVNDDDDDDDDNNSNNNGNNNSGCNCNNRYYYNNYSRRF